MDAREVIYSRRAIRDFTATAVPAQTVRALIDAAMHAPTARNMQPWAFVIIQDHALMERLSRRARLLMHSEIHADDPEFNLFYNASTLILLCAKPVGFHPDWDCCLAAENLMLAATHMGVATCPIGSARTVFELEDVKKELGIPEEYEPVMPIVVGYARTTPKAPPREPPEILCWKKSAVPV